MLHITITIIITTIIITYRNTLLYYIYKAETVLESANMIYIGTSLLIKLYT